MVICVFYFKKNVFLSAFEEVLLQSRWGNLVGEPQSKVEYIIKSLQRNIQKMFPFNVCSILTETLGRKVMLALCLVMLFISLYIWLKKHKPLKEMYMSFLLLLVAAIPYIYYMLIPVHTHRHYWAEYRYQGIAFLALSSAYIYSIKYK